MKRCGAQRHKKSRPQATRPFSVGKFSDPLATALLFLAGTLFLGSFFGCLFRWLLSSFLFGRFFRRALFLGCFFLCSFLFGWFLSAAATAAAACRGCAYGFWSFIFH